MIRKAIIDDIDAIMAIINQAKEDLKNNKVDQWQDGYPNVDVITNDINEGVGYVLIKEQVIGYFMLTNYEANYEKIEGSWLNDDDYLVIHRIAIANDAKRFGYASKIIDFVFNITANIKIDTHHDNIKMQNMLSKNNFTECGVIYLESKDKRTAYQKTK